MPSVLPVCSMSHAPAAGDGGVIVAEIRSLMISPEMPSPPTLGSLMLCLSSVEPMLSASRTSWIAREGGLGNALSISIAFVSPCCTKVALSES